ncbi:hypothetical protein E2C01_037295 [Portunus trituberculatus]|uniref:Uncharacterized protein n=1 Tax=Portunus trituberculatus TaxID=210409 RepID=A0A5B7FEY3_PORTR|nr:hypothetical protein [Portunus trituberculatus]
MYASITFVMRSAHRDGSLTRKQKNFYIKAKAFRRKQVFEMPGQRYLTPQAKNYREKFDLEHVMDCLPRITKAEGKERLKKGNEVKER